MIRRRPPTRSTSLSIAFAPTTVDLASTPSQTVEIVVPFTPSLSGKTIQIYYSEGARTGPWTLIMEGPTNNVGKISVIWTPPHTGTYYFRAVFPGDRTHDSSQEIDRATLNVVPEFSLATAQLLLAIMLASGALAIWKKQSHTRPR